MPRFHRVKKESEKIPISDYNLKSDYLEALANMKVTGGKFTISRAGASLDVIDGSEPSLYWAKLTSNLSAPSDSSVPSGGKTTARALKINSESAGISSEEIVITNRNPKIKAESGAMILVARVALDSGYEWQPVTQDLREVPESEPDPDFPVGFIGPCSCGDCQEGPTIPDGTVCCSGPLEWMFTNPFGGLPVTLTYQGEDIWASEDVGIGSCGCLDDEGEICSNLYRWELAPSLTPGQTVLRLLLVEDNGCPKLCLEYVGYERWQCKCPNVLTRTIWGNFDPDNQYSFSCKLCLSPLPPPNFAGDYGGEDWESPVCTLSQDDLPTVWRYSGNFSGGSLGYARGTTVGGAPAGAYTEVFTYSGTLTHISDFIGLVDVWADINILSQIPLIRAGTGSWQTAPITEFCGSSGAVVGETVPNIATGYCPTGPAEGDITIYSQPYVTRANLGVSCSGVSADNTVDISLLLNVPHVRMTPPFWLGDFSPQFVLRYTKRISDVPLEEVPCVINNTHTLCRDPTLAFENAPCDSLTGDALAACDRHCPAAPFDCCTRAAENLTLALDPPPSDFSIPGTVTISPFGGGPEECPNPGVDEIPPPPPPTDDGGCGGCVPDSGTPNPDTGSCCIAGRCFSNMSSELCTSFSGDFYNNQALCEDECIASACCYVLNNAATCVDSLTREECTALDSDAIWTPFALCESINCDITGACCNAGGTCTRISEYLCSRSPASVFFPGANCSEVACPVTGACCFSGITGVDCASKITQDACALYGGTWQGEGTSCSSCGTWGACCHKPAGVCTGLCTCEVMADESDCLAICSGARRIWALGETCSTAGTCANDTVNTCAWN